MQIKTRKLTSKLLKIGSGVADLVIHMKSASPLNLAAIGLRALHTHFDATATPDEYLKDWKVTGLQDLSTLLKSLCGAPVARHVCGNNNYVEEFDVFGIRIAFVGDSTNVYACWVQPPFTVEEAEVALGRLVWESLGSSVFAIFRQGPGYRSWSVTVDPLVQRPVLASKTAKELHEWCEPFIAARVPRTILLHGEPGSGKSCIMRYLAKLSGGLCLRLEGEDVARSGTDKTANLLRFLRPNIVLFDGLDRSNTSAMLSCLDLVRDFAKITIASANYTRLLDPAVRRPGRFDRMVEVTSLDPETVEALIGPDVPEEIAAKLRMLPVAYLDEFHLRRHILGIQAALEGVLELASRAEDIAAHGRSFTSLNSRASSDTKRCVEDECSPTPD
jgi:hypothetical protein